MALMAIGLSTQEVPAPLNVWMNNPVDPQGNIAWEPPVASPGDYIVLEALVDSVIVMSACPQDLVPVNGSDCIPKDLSFEVQF